MTDIIKKSVCERCRKAVPKQEIKYMPKPTGSSIALCKECQKSYNPEREKKEADKSKKPYICTRCKYRFRFNPSSGSILRCPYCGRTDSCMEEEQIDDLI